MPKWQSPPSVGDLDKPVGGLLLRLFSYGGDAIPLGRVCPGVTASRAMAISCDYLPTSPAVSLCT
ncbi:hypothetical protein VM1G_11814 [Cytospora mali]|uniref:Uncharacterized protein n=1 Tax=Cytospora mali TaxID=578113 RepID=A0A194W7G8_CYTMA|nr:hypothetical protein VM1G_11814 [Valsa mali]